MMRQRTYRKFRYSTYIFKHFVSLCSMLFYYVIFFICKFTGLIKHSFRNSNFSYIMQQTDALISGLHIFFTLTKTKICSSAIPKHQSNRK